MFGDVAPTYDLLNRLLSMGIDKRWRRRAVAASLREGDTSVLDLCCGTGDLAMEYRRRLKPDGSVVASDFTRPMLTRFQQKPHTEGIRMVEADSLTLPFPSDKFDVVSVAFGLRNLDGTLDGIAEMARVAKPGGRVVILEFCPGERPRLSQRLFRLYFHHILPRIGALVSRHPTAYSYLPRSVEGFPPREQLITMMEQASLRVETARDLTGGIATLFVGEKAREPHA